MSKIYIANPTKRKVKKKVAAKTKKRKLSTWQRLVKKYGAEGAKKHYNKSTGTEKKTSTRRKKRNPANPAKKKTSKRRSTSKKTPRKTNRRRVTKKTLFQKLMGSKKRRNPTNVLGNLGAVLGGLTITEASGKIAQAMFKKYDWKTETLAKAITSSFLTLWGDKLLPSTVVTDVVIGSLIDTAITVINKILPDKFKMFNSVDSNQTSNTAAVATGTGTNKAVAVDPNQQYQDPYNQQYQDPNQQYQDQYQDPYSDQYQTTDASTINVQFPTTPVQGLYPRKPVRLGRRLGRIKRVRVPKTARRPVKLDPAGRAIVKL